MSLGGELLIVEDDAARPDFPYIKERAPYAFVSGDTVCYWTRLGSMQPPDVETFVSRGGTGHPTNAFSIEDGPDSFAPFERVSRERLTALSRATPAILVSAYDAESYVLWSPTRLDGESPMPASKRHRQP